MRERSIKDVCRGSWFRHKPTLLFPDPSQCYAICQVENIIVFSAPFAVNFTLRERQESMPSMHYAPWRLFPWWFTFDSQTPAVFAPTGAAAGLRGVTAAMAALGEAVWWSSRKPRPTTYGSARWADIADVVRAALLDVRNVVIVLVLALCLALVDSADESRAPTAACVIKLYSVGILVFMIGVITPFT